MVKTGVLLINLGTPDDTSVRSIRRYLREFLLDPRVIDLPAPLRYLLVYGAILPFRPYKTAEAYKKVWRTDGSPLRLYTDALCDKVAIALGESYQVESAMRYGKPSLAAACASLSHCERVIVLPLFPQYASAASGSAIARALTLLAEQWNIPQVEVVDKFYDTPAFLDPYAALLKRQLAALDPDTFVLFSYHGLPERHLDKSACRATCDRLQACPRVGEANYFCYRAQCYQTTAQLVERLTLPAEQTMTAFQSRLGRIPWIKPYTDQTLPVLRERGITKLAIACPAFVADCLETLEEIGLQAKAQWQALGGEQFTLLPCLNDDDAWAASLAGFIADK